MASEQYAAVRDLALHALRNFDQRLSDTARLLDDPTDVHLFAVLVLSHVAAATTGIAISGYRDDSDAELSDEDFIAGHNDMLRRVREMVDFAHSNNGGGDD